MSTKYAEGLLAIKYRQQTTNGNMLGGPMYALEKGLGWKKLAIMFAIFTAIASFGIGNTVQANAIATIANSTYGISPWIMGSIVCALTAAVILGGVKSIAKVCGMLVPFMALFYVIGCIYILIVNHNYLWPALSLIVNSAFSPQAAGGGFVGTSVMMAARYGKPCTGGSDSHEEKYVGMAYTEIDADIRCNDDLIEAVKEHRITDFGGTVRDFTRKARHKNAFYAVWGFKVYNRSLCFLFTPRRNHRIRKLSIPKLRHHPGSASAS